jgi:hypothetical protein
MLPFEFVNAFTDLSDNTIYISKNLNPLNLDNIIKDEFAHLLSRSPLHDKKWETTCISIYGLIPEHCDQYDSWLESVGGNNIGMNIGNITGIQNLLLDYHLLQAYRRFSAKILGTEGSWEVNGDHKLRLKPTPKGSFPVVVRYLPSIDEFHLPVAAELTSRMCLAEARIMLGMARRKMLVPSPDGGTMTIDGEALVTEGREERKAIVEEAIQLGEPLGFVSK